MLNTTMWVIPDFKGTLNELCTLILYENLTKEKDKNLLPISHIPYVNQIAVDAS